MTTPLTDEQLARIRQHHAEVTDYAPAPWRWCGSVEAHRPTYFLATENHGRKFVMGMSRAGFSGAEPEFPVIDAETGWGLLKQGREIAVREQPYRDQIADIDNPFAEYLKRSPEYVGALLAELTSTRSQLAEADTAMTQVIDERDEYHDGADKLAAVIAEVTGSDIGEHSSMNDPWQNALDLGRKHLTQLAKITAERDRYREHSITLNTVAWKLATALGDVPAGADQVSGNPVEQADRLIELLGIAARALDIATGPVPIYPPDEVAQDGGVCAHDGCDLPAASWGVCDGHLDGQLDLDDTTAGGQTS